MGFSPVSQCKLCPAFSFGGYQDNLCSGRSPIQIQGIIYKTGNPNAERTYRKPHTWLGLGQIFAHRTDAQILYQHQRYLLFEDGRLGTNAGLLISYPVNIKM